MERKFKPGDHVKVVYGNQKVHYGKTGIIDRIDSGTYRLIVDDSNEILTYSKCTSLEYSVVHESPLWLALR